MVPMLTLVVTAMLVVMVTAVVVSACDEVPV
jgi:hypothetical protein